MEKLSAELKVAIEKRPTKTYLRSTSKYNDDQFIKYTKIYPAHKVPIPDSFDGRIAWDGCLSRIQNQGTCGSCWAFATTTILADRLAIQSMGLFKVNLSPMRLIMCDARGTELDIVHPEDTPEQLHVSELETTKDACTGNSLTDAFRYLLLIGTNTEECLPYNSVTSISSDISNYTDTSQVPLCTAVTGDLGDMCGDYEYNTYTREVIGTPARFYRIWHFYGIRGVKKDDGSEFNIRHDIYKSGPVCTAMKVYPDFYTFDAKKEIYSWNGEGEQIAGHAIVLLGWGVEDEIPYWIVRNTWGSKWGMDGYFRMKRGTNECEIEENCFGIVPDYFYPHNYKNISDSYIQTDENLLNQRTNIDLDTQTSGGGIDPTTGYIRRVIELFPWLNLNRPVDLDDLPDMTKWIAGLDATSSNRAMYQAVVRQRRSETRYSIQTYTIYIAVISILLLSILGVLFYWRRSRR